MAPPLPIPFLPALGALLSALIQLAGDPLAGGRAGGSARVPLERARGGDTPVLTLSSPRGPVRLLLDTGASSSMVTPALAGRLGLRGRPLPEGVFDLAGGGRDCGELRPGRVALPPLELGAGGEGGGLRLEGAEALLMPAGALPAGVDGVLGAPSLRHLPVRIDPRRDTVSLGAAALAESRAAGPPRLTVPLRWRTGVPVLTLTTVAGPVEALADTGAEGLFLSPSLAERLHPLGRARPLRLVGFCGEQRVEQRPYTGIALPGEPLPGARPGVPVRELEGVVTDNPIFPQLGVEAIVGQELLRRRPQLWRLDAEPPRLELW
ncbi:MAG: aspartyl protease family protein [Synechococcaceae cyanobacterium]|nr:aspartyl protease family protein [Synechococcaceae cyanobacterium]